MCLPAGVNAIDAAAQTAVVAVGEVKKEISLALVEEVGVDDYVLVHVGYALRKLSREEAEETLALLYSTRDALKVARDNPRREIVFFAIGFETTPPPPEAQLLSNLKLSGKKLGLLIDFNVVHLKDGIKRIVNNL